MLCHGRAEQRGKPRHAARSAVSPASISHRDTVFSVVLGGRDLWHMARGLQVYECTKHIHVRAVRKAAACGEAQRLAQALTLILDHDVDDIL